MSASPPLRLHAFEPRSFANGPGLRAVVWVQGCTLGCAGCFNPLTHPRGGTEVAVDSLVARISALDGIEGVTVSGGEPLQQRGAVLHLLRRLRAETPLSAILFTGYAYDELTRMPDVPQLSGCVDVLLAGRYEQRRHLAHGLRGSANKTMHLFTNRYTPADLDDVPDAEVIIGPDGAVAVSGIDPPMLGLPPSDDTG